MLSIPITSHAVARMQQRAIFPEIVGARLKVPSVAR